MSDEDRARAGRQLARDGHFSEAIAVLKSVANKDNAFVLTYLGYSHRKLGDIDLGISLYKKALEIDPTTSRRASISARAMSARASSTWPISSLPKSSNAAARRCEEYQALEKAMLSGALAILGGSMSAITGQLSAARLKTIGFWVLKLVLAALFLLAGGAKLAGLPAMVAVFEQVGLGQWFRYFTGVLEVGGALLLLWPATTGSRRSDPDDRQHRGRVGAASRSA